MKLALVSSLVLLAVSVVSAGWLVARGVGSATSLALEWARPVITEAVPADLVPPDLEARIDRALAAVRDGDVDKGAVRDLLVWLPIALLDAQLDAAEIAALADRLDRLLVVPPPAAAPPAGAAG